MHVSVVRRIDCVDPYYDFHHGLIGWPAPEGGPGGLDGPLDAGDLVGPEIVGNDDVAGLQGRHQDLFDVVLSPSIAPSKTPGAVSPVTRHAASNVRVCQAPAGGVVVDARAARCPAVPPKQIGGDAGFVQTHEVGDIPGRRRRVPRDPRGRDVRPIVFGRADRFF